MICAVSPCSTMWLSHLTMISNCLPLSFFTWECSCPRQIILLIFNVKLICHKLLTPNILSIIYVGHCISILKHVFTANTVFDTFQAGETCLHVAARYGHIDVVEFLCRAGANVDLQDKVRNVEFHLLLWSFGDEACESMAFLTFLGNHVYFQTMVRQASGRIW